MTITKSGLDIITIGESLNLPELFDHIENHPGFRDFNLPELKDTAYKFFYKKESTALDLYNLSIKKLLLQIDALGVIRGINFQVTDQEQILKDKINTVFGSRKTEANKVNLSGQYCEKLAWSNNTVFLFYTHFPESGETMIEMDGLNSKGRSVFASAVISSYLKYA